MELTSAGCNSALTARLRTAGGEIFVKGMCGDDPQAWTLLREAQVNPYVVALSPRLLWHVEVDGWHVLAFEHVPGRPADLSPGSPDLPKVADMLRRLAAVAVADLALEPLSTRWRVFLDEPTRRLLCGDSLVHTDLNPDNILVDGTAHVVDWAWPAQGPAWIDLACLALHLVVAGHPPPEADAWMRQFPAWLAAPAEAVDTLSAANARIWRHIADANAGCTAMASAAGAWAAYRAA